MGEVDPAFIQEPEHRPKISYIEGQGIPLIDLSPIHSPDNVSAIEGLVKEIGSACKEWGFFQVINHGVPLEKREKIYSASRKFSALSAEEKSKVRKSEKKVYGHYDNEHTKNVKDWREVFDFTINDPVTVPASPEPDDEEVTEWKNQWPQYPPELREVCQEYTQEMVKLAYKLMELIALSLGLPADRFHDFFKDQTSYIRLNHYNPCPAPHLALGLGRHQDSGVLTILNEDDVGGLEVKRKTDGEWVRVKSAPDAYIINIGDTTQVWTNDEYESVEHRVVVNSERERFSIAFFLHASSYTMVEPLEELTSEQNPAKYRAYSWGKFITHRKRSNFQKLSVENVQISHFKITQ
ncbi:protein DMR6-LIKE OXYGENASE 2-like [Quercus lobata]|uniref:Fe2OG dioxygenase domain-containing protein n=1 Tax=Quercus lobata TaxID=97700 RepID=A0A7N2N160_QUELO|nr:protein DMR6-LIKE OXYGENASE 2-like [Quercus lobata]